MRLEQKIGNEQITTREMMIQVKRRNDLQLFWEWVFWICFFLFSPPFAFLFFFFIKNCMKKHVNLTDLNIKQSQQAQRLLKASPMTIKVKNSKKKLLVFILNRKKFRSPQWVVLNY